MIENNNLFNFNFNTNKKSEQQPQQQTPPPAAVKTHAERMNAARNNASNKLQEMASQQPMYQQMLQPGILPEQFYNNAYQQSQSGQYKHEINPKCWFAQQEHKFGKDFISMNKNLERGCSYIISDFQKGNIDVEACLKYFLNEQLCMAMLDYLRKQMIKYEQIKDGLTLINCQYVSLINGYRAKYTFYVKLLNLFKGFYDSVKIHKSPNIAILHSIHSHISGCTSLNRADPNKVYLNDDAISVN